MVGTRYFESTEKVGRGAILPFFLLITYGHSQLSIIGGVRFFVAGGVRAFGGEALAQVVDFVVVLFKKIIRENLWGVGSGIGDAES